MSKRLMLNIGWLIILLILAFVAILVYDNNLFREAGLNSPNHFSSYYDTGYYKIDPETILTSLDSGRTDVFTSFLENPDDIEEANGIPVQWTQADFLKIASAIGKFAWDDPMNLKDWQINFILFRGSCDDPMGFSFATFTFFRARTTWYETRLIEIDPKSGWVRWGNRGSYSKPILRRWNSVDLLGAKITADDALQIASKDAKNRFQFKDYCDVFMATPQNNDVQNWYLDFMGTRDPITYLVNLNTGVSTFQNPNK